MLQKQFENYLLHLGLSSKSIKNYKSDYLHFLGWAILKMKSIGTYVEELSELVPFLSHNLASEYKNFMIENSFPTKTVNRRLSTLRHLSRFLLTNQVTGEDFTQDLPNTGLTSKRRPVPTSLIDNFTAHLEAEKVSKNTIKNYQSDIRQFLNWLENNHARFA